MSCDGPIGKRSEPPMNRNRPLPAGRSPNERTRRTDRTDDRSKRESRDGPLSFAVTLSVRSGQAYGLYLFTGASRGIGLAIVQALVEHGCRVVGGTPTPSTALLDATPFSCSKS